MASSRRSITTVMRAETGQYVSAMDSAAKATSKVGDAAQATEKKSSGLGSSGSKIADGIQGSSQKATGALGQMRQSIEQNRQSWETVGTTLTVAGGAVTAFGIAALNTGIQYNTLQQTSRAALESLLGSAQAANAQMDKLDEFASSSPFAKDVFITAQQQMLAFGIEAQKVVPYLDAIQNAVAAAGGSNEDIAGISATFSKIQSSAKITAEDLNELGNRGVNAAELIGSQMGMTGAQVRDSITNGTLGAQEALDALAAGMSDRFSGAAANVKNTFAGAMDRVKAAWRDFSSELAAPLVDPAGGGALVSMLNGLADAMRGFQGLPDPLKKTVTYLGLIGGVAATAAGGLILLVPKAKEVWTSFSKIAADVPKLNSGLKGIGKAAGYAAGVVALVGALEMLNDATDKAALSTEEVENRLARLPASADPVKDMFGDMVPKDSDLRRGEQFAGFLDDMANAPAWKQVGAHASDLGISISRIWGDDTAKWGELKERVQQYGESLASLSQSDLPQAQSAFKAMYDEAGGTNEAGKNLLKSMPALREALVGVAQSSGLATDDATLLKIALGQVDVAATTTSKSTGELASAQDVLARALESTNPQILAQAEQYKTLIDGASKAGSAFLDLSDDLGKSEFSLDGWLKKLESQAEATQKWADNIQKLAQKGASVDLLQGLIDQGPAAAQAVNALANGTEADMKRAEKAIGGATGATNGLQDALGEEFVVKLNTEAARRQGESTADYISRLQATIEVTGNSVPARKDGESTQAYISRLRAVMGIDANGNPARKEGESTSAYIKRLKQTMKIDGNAVPARREGETAEHYISRLEAKMGIDGNNAPAKQKGREAQNDINGRDATIDVDANTGPAQASIGSWLSGLQGKVATLRTRVIRTIEERTVKGKAGGGAVHGPGTGTSDSIDAKLSDGEHVLTANDVQAMGGQGAVYSFRAGLHSGSQPFASGGAVRSAESAVKAARRRREAAAAALRKARRSKAANKEKRVNAAQKTYDKRTQALQDQRERLARLRDEEREQRIGIRRGDQRSQATSGISGAYGVVDEMFSVARSGDLTKSQANRLSKKAYAAEKSMRKLYKSSDGIAKKLEKATDKMAELQQISDSVADTLTGGFKLGEITSPWTGGAATSGKEYLTSAKQYAAKTKAFASKLKALQKKGYSGVILQEVAAMGVEEGTVAADALLQLNPKDTSAMNQAYKDVAKYSDQAGQYVSAGFYKGGLAAAEGLVSGLKKDQKKIEKQINNMATSMIKALKKALGIKSPSKEFAQIGLQTGEGMVVGLKASAGDVARASEDLAQIPSAVIPAAYANPPKAGNQQVVAVVDKGAMADAMNGTRMTLLVDGKQMDAVVQTTVDRNLTAVATTLGGGRR